MNISNWEVQIDFEINNNKKSQLAKGLFYFYFLRDNPQKTPGDFARGLNQLINGLMIEVKEHNSRLQPKNQYEIVDGVPVANLNKHHDIYGLYTAETMHPLNNKLKSHCQRFFYESTISIRYQNGELTVSTRNATDTDFKDCFSFQADLNYEGYIFIAAHSGKAVNNRHSINSIKTFNLDQLASSQFQDPSSPIFEGDRPDILYYSRDHFKDSLDQYNKQLIRHTNIYTNLITEFVGNNQKIMEMLAILPKNTQHQIIYRALIDNEAQVEKLRSSVKSVIDTHYQSFSGVGGGQSQNQNFDGLITDQKVITQQINQNSNQLNIMQTSLNNDQLIDIISQDKSGFKNQGRTGMSATDFKDEDIEIQLEKMINLMLVGSKDMVQNTVQTDDYIDYIIISVLIVVAVGGFFMWRKMQEQKQRILL